MRRTYFTLMSATVSALALGLLLTGCGKKKDDEGDDLPSKPSRSKGDSGGGSKAALLKPVVAQNKEYGVIRGKINWVGDPPSDLAEKTAKLRADMITNRDYCLMGKEYETTQQSYRIGDNKGLGNVFVWIVPEAGHYFDIPKDQLDKFAGTDLTLSQPHCAFLPHCAVLFPSYYKDGKQVPTGQKLKVENDASVDHNSKVQGGPRNPERNTTLSKKEGGRIDSKEYTLNVEAAPITVSCGIHSWMRGYLRTFDHPYAAVSSTGGAIAKKQYEDPKSDKFGTYEITGVPVGAKVRIIAWHEALEFLDGNQGKPITIAKEQTVDFEAKK